jgi:hypothetical protein
MAAKKKVVKQSRPKTKKRIVKVAPQGVTHETVAKRAYEIWLRKNHVAETNYAQQNWSEAEAELRAGSGK